MDSYTFFLACAFMLSVVIDLVLWIRSRSLAIALNMILFASIGIVVLIKNRPGDGTEFFGYLSLVMGVGWALYGVFRYIKKST